MNIIPGMTQGIFFSLFNANNEGNTIKQSPQIRIAKILAMPVQSLVNAV